MWIFDAHLDLAMNAVEWNRDLTQPLRAIRDSEAPLHDKPDRGRGTVSLPEMRRGQIGLCVATLIARVEHDAYSPVQGWRSQPQAWAMTQAQRAWYQCMEEAGEMQLIASPADLQSCTERWDAHSHSTTPNVDTASENPEPNASNDAKTPPVGFVLSLEGADALVTLDHLHRLHAAGLRVVGPAHYGPGVYAQGTDTQGPFPPRGRQLLREMASLGMILDVTHLSDECFWEAIEHYDGPLWASHHNCRALVPHQRQLSDEQIRALIARDAVIGAALDAWMLAPGWVRGSTTPAAAGVTLQTVTDHIDHVCQLAGNSRHAGLGSDLDGAFGTEQVPQDMESIADLQGILTRLQQRGYDQDDTRNIAHGNWTRFLQNALPDT